MPPGCAHPRYRDGRCTECGQVCEHEMILNGACHYCGSTDLDGVALSIKPADELIPATRLVRKARDDAGQE